EGLAQADLARAPLGREGRQAEQAETGDEDRDADEHAEQRALTFIRLELPVIVVVQEMPLDGDAGREGMPGAVDEGERILCVSRTDADRKIADGKSAPVHVHCAFDGILGTI